MAIEDRLVRRNLTLYASTEEIMKRLRERLEATSDTEVVRYALRYLDQLIDDQSHGRHLIVRRLDRTTDQISYASLRRRPDENAEIIKRNVIMSEAVIRRVERMKGALGVSSDSEIVRRAIRYLDLVLDEADHGSDFVILEGPHETRVRMDMFVQPERRAENARRRTVMASAPL